MSSPNNYLNHFSVPGLQGLLPIGHTILKPPTQVSPKLLPLNSASRPFLQKEKFPGEKKIANILFLTFITLFI